MFLWTPPSGLGQRSTGPLLSHCKDFILKLCTWGLAGMSRTWRSPCKTLHNRNTCTTMLSLHYSKVRFTSAFSQGQFFLFLINWPAHNSCFIPFSALQTLWHLLTSYLSTRGAQWGFTAQDVGKSALGLGHQSLWAACKILSPRKEIDFFQIAKKYSPWFLKATLQRTERSCHHNRPLLFLSPRLVNNHPWLSKNCG